MLARHLLCQPVLHDVRVLELVYQQVAVAVCILLQGLGGTVEELDGLEKQVVEIHAVVLFEDGLVTLKDPAHDLVEIAVDVKAVVLGVDHLALGCRDGRAHAPGREVPGSIFRSFMASLMMEALSSSS